VIELDRTVLREFATEMDEHVASCEQVLIRASTETVYEQDYHLLLRSMHSIKGLARVLGSAGMEKLAHATETVLAAIRDGGRALDGPTQDLLLRVLDAFGHARARIVEGGEFHPDDALLRELATSDAGARAEPAAAGLEAPAGLADGDLYFDQPTLFALGELFEEILPAIARAVAAAEVPVGQVVEDIGTLEFALDRVGFTALDRAVCDLADRSRPAGFARCLHLVERFGDLIERDCGVREAVRLSRPWLSVALLEALEEGRWSDVGWILRAVLPQSPLVGLLPQVLNATCPDDTRQLALQVVADTLRTELAPGAASSTDLGALAADRIRDLLGQPHQVPTAVLTSLDTRRLDLDRFRWLPAELAARLASVVADPSLQLYEIVLQSATTRGGLADLARLAQPIHRGLDPLLAETLVIDDTPTLVALVASALGDERLRARVGQLTGSTVAATVRPLDQQPGDAHFRVKVRPTADPGGNRDLQVRVPVALLDSMFGRLGQFFGVTTRFNALVFDSDVSDILNELADYSVLRAPQLLPKIDRLVRQQREYATLEAETHRLISVIHEMTLGLRVIPIDTLFARFPRVVHDLAHKQGKEVRLDAQSNGIRVDNGMLELLADPLTHMIRNCIDHGIEPPTVREKAAKPRAARLTLHTEQRGNHIVIEVGDDGRGIDLERVLERAIEKNLVDAATAATLSEDQIARFIFSPGFSTAERVTETSGRGVGMDVALVNVTKLGGVIDIVTQRGRGTTFRIDIPLSKAIQSMLIAETGVQTVAFPDRMVAECVVAPASEVQSVNGQRAIVLHDRFLPLFGLVDLLKLPAAELASRGNELAIVVCEVEGRRVGFEVHRIRRRTDLLIQEMHPRIAKLPGIGGISTLGTDKIVIVVDPEGLFDLARRQATFGLRSHAVRVAEGLF
jgi:two-component system chemotaxis sensor kinase CheA